jgi:2,3-bisphosphoglycerate-dependent phosphoglycerate mutase
VAIYVVRHGETELNASRVFQQPATPLSERGRLQADRVAARLAPLGVARILTSDLARAVETAEAIAARTGAPIVVDALLRERDFGDIRGLPYDVLGENPFGPDYHPPNGESWETFRARVVNAWALVIRSAAATEGNLAVVTHGLVCGALVERHLALAADMVAPTLWSNTALTEVDAAPPWTVRVLACTAHLAELESPGGSLA